MSMNENLIKYFPLFSGGSSTASVTLSSFVGSGDGGDGDIPKVGFNRAPSFTAVGIL